MLSQARKMTDVWVLYNESTGSVAKIMYRDPKPAEVPKAGSGVGMFKTQLSDWALLHLHQLRVREGAVVHTPALAGI